jgi:DNA processing protein
MNRDGERVLETAALIALVRHAQRPWHHYAELVETGGSALAVMRGETEEVGTGSTQLFPLKHPRLDVDLKPIVREIEAWTEEGIHLVTVLDDDYPRNLRTIHNRPPFLFIQGASTPDDELGIAVVGTRRASSEGLESAREMAAGLTSRGYVVVSGLAAGVDTAAHTAALEGGGRTIAVIGTGIRRAYPAENADLQKRLAQESAVISQFWPDAPPTKRSFPMRNVVMSGLALATVVIEASGRSGARMQARFALEHGRPVFLLRRVLREDWAGDYINRPGVYAVDSAAEVVDRVARLTQVETLTA